MSVDRTSKPFVQCDDGELWGEAGTLVEWQSDEGHGWKPISDPASWSESGYPVRGRRVTIGAWRVTSAGR